MPHPVAAHLSNLERAAQLLNDLPALWSHEGVTEAQREAFIKEVFSRIDMDGGHLVVVRSNPAYEPLFAASIVQHLYGYPEKALYFASTRHAR